MSRMFPFITKTWNPLAGECAHNCNYCWAKELIRKNNFPKYKGKCRLDEKQINRGFKKGDFVFVQDMTDLFGKWVDSGFIRKILEHLWKYPNAKFLLLTKNPKRYFEFLYPQVYISENCILGCTIESDRIEPEIGKAPNRFDRLFYMTHLKKLMVERGQAGKIENQLFISIEPILDFNYKEFSNVLCNWIHPWGVAIGYDNYGNNLPEPSLSKTKKLIDDLEFNCGITVYKKTLRESFQLTQKEKENK